METLLLTCEMDNTHTQPQAQNQCEEATGGVREFVSLTVIIHYANVDATDAHPTYTHLN